MIPPESYDDATVQTLMREANRYLGMPYTFGGTAPASFDCSGFVCWVFTNSGVHNLPRTTAQGIYDQCTPVSAADAKAGDIIFLPELIMRDVRLHTLAFTAETVRWCIVAIQSSTPQSIPLTGRAIFMVLEG